MGKQAHILVAVALARLAAGQVNLTNSFAFQFDGCCRGGMAQTWTLMKSNTDFNACAQMCLNSSWCNAIEVNGCNKLQCNGNCYHFYGDGVDLNNGRCLVDGTQKCYQKISTPALAGLKAGQAQLTNSFAFQFDGCCRGGLAQTWTLMGSNMDFNGCTKICRDSSTCNAIEVNGCNGLQCKGNCWNFNGNGFDLNNGNCLVDGTQKCYKKMPTPAPTPTPTPLPTPLPTPVPTPIVNLKSGGGWIIVKGSCSINMTTGRPCVVNGNYPENYRGEEECRVNTTGALSFATFSTEKWFDYVRVGDVEYSGDVTGRLANGSELIWSSDFYVEGPGWMICQTKDETPRV